MKPEVDNIYPFNNARAHVIYVDAEVVQWRELRRGVQRINGHGVRTTPRWYFEKYAEQSFRITL